MNKKISQFELTTKLQEQDLITLVQDGSNKNITSGSFTTSLSGTFATNERVDAVEEDVEILDTKVNDNYKDLSNKIVEGDTSVTTNLNSAITSYYDVLNNKIITLDTKHDTDMSEIGGTMQEWIDDIDNRSTLQQLQDALSRLTVAENTITALAEVIANGGGSGSTPGYHTQSTATIFPLSGYYKANDASPLATSDTLNQALSKLENQVEAVVSSSGSLPVIKSTETTQPSDGTLYTSLKTEKTFLNKYGDTAEGRIDFKNGLQGGTIFRSGWDGQGASLYPFGTKWNLELDNLFVRGNMTVNELTVNEIKAVGGDILVTLGDMKCIKVEEKDNGYKCYFDTEDGTKYNEFIVNDQAICQKFDGHNVKRYWRAVTEVGSDYILLSKDVCEPGSSVPSADDEILLLGHRVEGDAEYDKQMEDRRNAIFISAKGSNAPRIAFYSGINDFTLEGKDKTVIGKDSKFVGTITVVSKDGTETGIPIYRGTWSVDKQYYYYDCVTYNGSTWIATQDNIGKEPKEGSPYWTIYIAKGENGQAGDDVAKWVEIVGNRMFLYDSTDFSGTPTPNNLGLNANVYGIVQPSYQWTNVTNNSEIVGYGNSLIVTPEMVADRTAIFRCTVTDSNTQATYYDETQVVKLANGAEGLDAYYIDLTNYSASVPFDSSGTILIDPSTIYTDVFAYHGITQIPIISMTAKFTEGSGTCEVKDNRVSLKTLTSTSARITLTIEVDEGVTVTKDWYINQSKNGLDGFNGEDAIRTYLTGEQFFHYAEYAKIPTPQSITLKMDTTLMDVASYKWYWKVSGTSEWTLLEGETKSELVVVYNGIYFQTGEDEITFRCVVTSVSGMSFEDIITINNVRDGESAYRGALDNESMTVPANYEGVVSDWSQATTYANLRRGGTKFANTEYILTSSQLSGVGTLSINQEKKQITVNSSSIPENYITVQWQINFVYEGQVVDTVVLSLVKNVTGKNGDIGNSSIQIYCNTNSTPTRPTFTEMISSSGGTSGSFAWFPDPTNSTTTLTWTSTGYLNPNTNKIDLLPDKSGYRWTQPVIFSPLNGKNGSNGIGISSVTMQYYKSTSPTALSGGSWSSTAPKVENGYWIWTRLYIVFDDKSYSYTNAVCTTGATGSTGDYGPGLSYRGEYSSSTSYSWTTNSQGNVRDIVKHSGSFYAVNRSKKGAGTFSGKTPSLNEGTDGGDYYWVKFNSFDNVATDLLFADKATIAGWDFYNTNIQSQSGTMRLDGRTTAAVTSKIHLAIGSNAASAPGSAPFRVNTDGECYTSKLNAVGGTIGGFTIESSQMVGNNTDSYGNKFLLSPSIIRYGSPAKKSTYVAFGPTSVSASTGIVCPVYILNTINDRGYSGNGSAMIIQVGSSAYRSAPQRWIDCNHYKTNSQDYGWGSGFFVESRYLGDSNNMERTILNVGSIPTFQALVNAGLVTSATGSYEMRVTTNGYIYAQ